MSLKKAVQTLVDELPLAETLKAELHKEILKEKKVKAAKKAKPATDPTPAEVKQAVAEADVTAAPVEGV
jgi:hypothetical protein